MSLYALHRHCNDVFFCCCLLNVSVILCKTSNTELLFFFFWQVKILNLLKFYILWSCLKLSRLEHKPFYPRIKWEKENCSWFPYMSEACSCLLVRNNHKRISELFIHLGTDRAPKQCFVDCLIRKTRFSFRCFGVLYKSKKGKKHKD